jgi:hypothetical protein
MTARVHPASILALNGCSASISRGTNNGVSAGQRRAWDSNPRCRVNDTAVFKTAAIGH